MLIRNINIYNNLKRFAFSLLRSLTSTKKNAVIKAPLAVSFVTGYEDHIKFDHSSLIPCLWELNNKKNRIHAYPFPRTTQDFHNMEIPLLGKMPAECQQNMETLPRFGLTGLDHDDELLYAGSWNGVYLIRKKDFSLEGILSHSLICDPHGICLGDDMIFTILTCKDTVVISSREGELIDHFIVRPDLSLYRDECLMEVDWRFISKQRRGSVGLFHFNYVKKYGDELYLTSRNLSCFVVIDLKKRLARLRPLDFVVPNLIHDGLLHEGKYYFTSINGQVHIATDSDPNNIYNSDLLTENFKLKRFPNWTRGLEVVGDRIYVTINGRYGERLGFGVQEIDHKGRYQGEVTIGTSAIANRSSLNYMTGFDIVRM